MWSLNTARLDHSQTIKFVIEDNNHVLTHSDVIELWLSNNKFRLYFIDLLCDNDLDAFFWEMPPITIDTLDKPFECIINSAQTLVSAQADVSTFNTYFDSGDDVVSFTNLINDALLVAPTPLPTISPGSYTHLASFMRQAPEQQQHHLLQKLAEAIQNSLSDRPLWVSTSGLGVYWLHVRLDRYPKYYTFAPYRQADFYIF